jgi:hypothetical protein
MHNLWNGALIRYKVTVIIDHVVARPTRGQRPLNRMAGGWRLQPLTNLKSVQSICGAVFLITRLYSDRGELDATPLIICKSTEGETILSPALSRWRGRDEGLITHATANDVIVCFHGLVPCCKDVGGRC